MHRFYSACVVGVQHVGEALEQPPDGGYWDFDAILVIQLMVGLLSQSDPNAWCLIAGLLSIIAATANSSAASSKSEVVMDPHGLLLDTTVMAMSGGNVHLQTNGGICLIIANHTPPAPSMVASWYATYNGMSRINSLTFVGLELMRGMSMYMSLIAVLQSLISHINDDADFMSALRGVKKPWTAGRITAVCCTFPTVVCKDFRGAFFCCINR